MKHAENEGSLRKDIKEYEDFDAKMSKFSASLPKMVLHVLNAAGGGAALSTIGIIEGLQKNGISSCVLCHDIGSEQEKQRLSDVVEGRIIFTHLFWWNQKIRSKQWKRPAIELLQLFRNRFFTKSLSAAKSLIKEHHVDLIHSNTILTLEGAFAAAVFSLPHVWHLREMLGEQQPFRFKYEGRRFAKVVEALSSVVVANSYSSYKAVQSWFKKDALQVLENAIYVEKFAHIELISDYKPIVVAMVGSLHAHWKNHVLFIEIAQSMGRSDVEYRIYGSIPEETDAYYQKIKTLIKQHHHQTKIRLMGFVDDPVHIMEDIDILFHPSGQESFGRIAVEAMAAGRVVLGLNQGGISDIVVDGATGLLAEDGDSSGLKRRLNRLLDNTLLCRQLGEAGRERAQKRYAQDVLDAKIVKVYSEAMVKPVKVSPRFLANFV